MAYLTEKEVRAAARTARETSRKSDADLLREARDTPVEQFDIFLSHSSMDKELILGAKKLLEDRGYRTYVDWIDDAQLDRSAVSREHAARLRARMAQCDNLFYAHTINAALSRWCPWELGFFDALRRPDERVFILPIVGDGQTYQGQEYLSLYETVDLARWHKPRPVRRPAPADSAFRERMLRDLIGLRRPML